ncbi:MAG: biotin transporter BioY [Gemmatimonadetes bacterium]|nr:biotin transporter BioY [Gemmatimonadota bacterium]
MKVAVLSDIHGNAEALDAVLERCDGLGVERIICLGDVVGYGADPGYCVDVIRDRADLLIAGNHDRAAVGLEDLSWMNQMAADAIVWTAERLDETQSALLSSLPFEHREADRHFVHGSPDAPETFPYILSESDARLALRATDARLTFVGHSHRAFICSEGEDEVVSVEGSYPTSADRCLVNVGSVGQPRDRDARASFCLIHPDEMTLELVRVAYDFTQTQRKILAAGLSPYLADRLSSGN